MNDQPSTQSGAASDGSGPAPATMGAESDGAIPEYQTPRPRKLVLLVRHGETTYNVERRLPGQVPGVALTEEGRRQALRAAVALGGLPLSAIVSSPLERAYATAEIIAQGRDLRIQPDPKLMDTDIGRWAGWVVDDLAKADPAWTEYVRNPDAPPPGIESQSAVMARSVAVVERVRRDPEMGDYVVLVAHGDVVKQIVAHYTGVTAVAALHVHIANASITALSIASEGAPEVLGVNWTAVPDWLTPARAAAGSAASGGAARAGEEVEGIAVGDAGSARDTSPAPSVTGAVPGASRTAE